MSTQLFSDEQTVDRRESPSIDHLLKQNRMKDLALNKATNLIQLLNIELEVERNSNSQNIQILQQNLRMQYQKEINELRNKVQLLERQIKKQLHTANSTEKTARHTMMTRANSSKSFENRKKKSLNKKYTEVISYEEMQKIQINPFMATGEIYRHQIIQLEQTKQAIIQQLNNFIKSQYDELEGLINTIQNFSQDYQGIVNHKGKQRKSFTNEFIEIIRSQNIMINSLRIYSQELEEIAKTAYFKLTSIISKPIQFSAIEEFPIENIAADILQKISREKNQWKNMRQSLQIQNDELKQILDSMIRLVKQDKKIK